MDNRFNDRVKILTKIGFSVAFFTLGVVLVFSDDQSGKIMGGGFLGTILGYWIK